MPRPRKNPDEILKRELRITPPNQQLIDWTFPPELLKFVAFTEGGGDTGKKLHYHCYIETTLTSQALPKWIYTQCQCIESGEKGNAVFFSRAPHDATYSYIAKGKAVAVRHNFSQTVIEEWFTQSDEYIKQRGKLRKREQRSRQDELNDMLKQVENDLQDKCVRVLGVEGVIQVILACCHHSSIHFPTRTQMEQYVNRFMYTKNEDIVVGYYARSFPQLRNHPY